MPKKPINESPPPATVECKPTLGLSPGLLAQRRLDEDKRQWCPSTDPMKNLYDPACNECYPKPVYYKDVCKANKFLKKKITPTPLVKSKCCYELGMELYYKLEIFHNSGSFHERQAIYVLHMLSEEQREGGILTASNGNWGLALAYQAQKVNVPLTLVMCVHTKIDLIEKCQNYGAEVVVYGKDLDEARKKALIMIYRAGAGTYINGYDHPHVIAAAGSIAIEILQELPTANVILMPVGGGGLIAGVATVIKRLRPDIKIYGIEPNICCGFFKAMANQRPYKTKGTISLADSVFVPTAGYNAFYTARSLIDKMILVQDDFIPKAILHMLEEEKMVVEGSGILGLAAITSEPNIVPELKGKKVVTIITGGNINAVTLPRILCRAKTAEGRLLVININLQYGHSIEYSRILKIFSNLDCNVIDNGVKQSWLEEDGNYIGTEDFDEFCDPNNPKIISYNDVVSAAKRTNSYITRTRCVAANSQRDFAMYLYYKMEFTQPSGSFKERGAINALLQLQPDHKKLGIVIASIGNEGIGFSYHASKLNIPVFVVMPSSTPVDRLQRCHSLGAKVIIQGNNLIEAQKFARALARDKGLTYINARDHPHVIAGYGTLALEIVEEMPFVDAIIVPVGTGGLAAAVAIVIKTVKPSCLVYGVEPELMPIFTKSLEKKEPTTLPHFQYHIVDNIAVNHVGVNAFANAKNTLDKMLLVKDDWVAVSMLHLVELEKFVVEGAAACTLATIIGNLVPELKLKNVVCVLSGGTVDNLQLNRSLERGLGVEGRLVKFTVGLKNIPKAQSELWRLLANGGYDMRHCFQDNSWVDGDTYTIEMKVVCATKDLDHALELKRIIEKAYPCTSTFEEPFNDRRTCPCYAKNFHRESK